MGENNRRGKGRGLKMRETRNGLGTRLLVIGVMSLLLNFTPLVFAQEEKEGRSYTLDFKRLIKQAEQNIKKVDEKLRKRVIESDNQEREAKAREYFEKGTTLYQEGKLEEAKEGWKKALELLKHPEMKDYIKENERRAREEEKRLEKEQKQLEAERKKVELEKRRALKKEIDPHYKKALSYYRDKSYNLAAQEFTRVLELDPQHKSAQDYLNKKIPDRIKAQRRAEEARRKKEEREREQAEKQRQRQVERQKKEQERKAKEEEKRLKAEKEKAERERLKAERERQKELKRQQEIERRLQEKLEKEQQAKEEFERKEEVRRLRKKIRDLSKEGKNLYRKKNYEKALVKFQEVLKLDPKNRYALRYLKLIQQRIEQEKEEKKK
jgi:tetratricopeptide (TPR) repeat protein